MRLVAVEARTRRGGCGNAVTSTDRIKLRNFYGSKSWVVFYRQRNAVADHNNWTSREKATYLAILLVQAADILQCTSHSGIRKHRRESEKVITKATTCRQPTALNSKPASSWTATHAKTSQQPSSNWLTVHLSGYPRNSFAGMSTMHSSIEWKTDHWRNTSSLDLSAALKHHFSSNMQRREPDNQRDGEK